MCLVVSVSSVHVAVFYFSGYTLMHPSLTRPYLLSEPPLHTDIIHYENIPKFELVRQNILRYGIWDASLNVSSPLGTRRGFGGAFREHKKCRTCPVLIFCLQLRKASFPQPTWLIFFLISLPHQEDFLVFGFSSSSFI